MTHTPGPWRYSLGDGHYAGQADWAISTDTDSPEISGVAHNIIDENDARLIAAAPDLLAALKASLDALHYIATLDSAPKATRQLAERDLAKASAAIAKAEGK